MDEYVEVRRAEMEAALDRHKEKLAAVEVSKRKTVWGKIFALHLSRSPRPLGEEARC